MKSAKRKLILSAVLAIVWLPLGAGADNSVGQDWKTGGHLKYQVGAKHFPSDSLAAALGANSYIEQSADARFNAETRAGRWEFVSEAQLLGVAGETVSIRRQELALPPGALAFSEPLLPQDRRELFDLSAEVADESDFQSVARLDRLSVAYLGENFVARLGRQPLSWGNGLVFQVFDVFNPFSPTEIDRDYKRGNDMLYGQWLTQAGDDLQLVMVPRRDPETGSLLAEQSSLGAKWHGNQQDLGLDYDLLLARHYENSLLGVGISHEVFGALARIDLTLNNSDSGDNTASLVANIDRSFVVAEHNLYLFAEYFRNGFGQTEDYSLSSSELAERIARGELFTVGRDVVALGGRLELHPLLNMFLNTLLNLNDRSGVSQLRAEYDLLKDWRLTLGFDQPFGGGGSEFGGIPIPGSEKVFSPSTTAYLRLSYFF